MKDVKVPKPETKIKRILVPVTPSEHKKVMDYCRQREVNLTDLVRYALQNTYELL